MENELHLREKTAIVSGPLSQLHQCLISRLCEMGCNVALLGADPKTAERFTSQMNDQREIKASYGRAAAIPVDFAVEREIVDAISRAAELFGGVDIYIDGLFSPDKGDFAALSDSNKVGAIVDYELVASLSATQAVLPFLRGRRRGRLLYLIHELTCQPHPDSMVHAAARSGLISLSQSLARELINDNISVNCVRLGLTEEFLLALSQGKSLAETENELRRDFPHIELTRTADLANIIAVMVSPLSQAISGQTILAHRGV